MIPDFLYYLVCLIITDMTGKDMDVVEIVTVRMINPSPEADRLLGKEILVLIVDAVGHRLEGEKSALIEDEEDPLLVKEISALNVSVQSPDIDPNQGNAH